MRKRDERTKEQHAVSIESISLDGDDDSTFSSFVERKMRMTSHEKEHEVSEASGELTVHIFSILVSNNWNFVKPRHRHHQVEAEPHLLLLHYC